MTTLQSIVSDETARARQAINPRISALDDATVLKLVQKVDDLKYLGRTGGRAASDFGDYLRFLSLPDCDYMAEFFARRWSDHVVYAEVPKWFRSEGETLFTLPRLEPSEVREPFYLLGIPKSAPGNYRDPVTKSGVRTAPRHADDYSNFIINAFVPDNFLMEVPNAEIADLLSNGLPDTDYADPYRFYNTVDEARGSLLSQMSRENSSAMRLGPKQRMQDFTLVAISSTHMVLDNSILYTRKLHNHNQGSRSYGVYYIGRITPVAVSISKDNIQ